MPTAVRVKLICKMMAFLPSTNSMFQFGLDMFEKPRWIFFAASAPSRDLCQVSREVAALRTQAEEECCAPGEWGEWGEWGLGQPMRCHPHCCHLTP